MSGAAVLADALAQRVDDLVPALLPSAKCKGGYWTIGNLSNEPGSSLYIHRSGAKVGKWSDTATGQFGDCLDLVNEVIGGGRDMPQAMRWARSWLRLDTEPLTAMGRGPRHIPPGQRAGE